MCVYVYREGVMHGGPPTPAPSLQPLHQDRLWGRKYSLLLGNAAHSYRSRQQGWSVAHRCVTGTNTKCSLQGRCMILTLSTSFEPELQQTAQEPEDPASRSGLASAQTAPPF